MAPSLSLRSVLALLSTLSLVLSVSAQTGASASPTTAPQTTFRGNSTTARPSPSSTSTIGTSGPPDVYLNVPELHVGRIELDVEDLSAHLNLRAKVANLVTLNAGVQVSVQKVNITIADVDAELELVVRLGTQTRRPQSLRSRVNVS